MPYQVYLNWTGDEYNGREILVFPNRQYADEFFNRCIETKAPGTNKPLTDVIRHSPQFWSYNMSDETRPFYFILENAKDLIGTTMAARISGYDNNHASGAMPVIPDDPTASVEYRSGGTYYIRTKSTPHLYWYIGSHNRIRLDTRKATKFQIDREDAEQTEQTDSRRVLVRKDQVKLTALRSSGSSDIGVWDNLVTTTHTPYRFAFGSFYNGDLGVDWDADNTIAGEGYVSYKVKHAGETWELVN